MKKLYWRSAILLISIINLIGPSTQIECFFCDDPKCKEKVTCADGIPSCYMAQGKKDGVAFYEADCAPYEDVCGRNIKTFPPLKEEKENADEGEKFRSDDETQLALDFCVLCFEPLCNGVCLIKISTYLVASLAIYLWLTR